MDRAIAGAPNGGGVRAPVAQAGEAEAPGADPNAEAGSGGGAGDNAGPSSAEATTTELSDEDQAALDALSEDIDAESHGRGQFDGCGWNPFCYPARAWSGAASWASDHVGDIPVLGPALRFAGGLLDGAWDGLFEVGRGLKEAFESIVWDFLIEDVAMGILGPPLKALAAPVNAIFGTHWLEDMSWIPLKDAGVSVGHFVVSIPRAWNAVTNAWHQLSLCANPWNGQSSEDRGHACGETVVVIADIVIGAKGVAKTAEAIRAARAARATALAEAEVGTGAVLSSAETAAAVREALGDVPGAARLPRRTVLHLEEAARALKLSERELRRLVDDVVRADAARVQLLDDLDAASRALRELDTASLYPSERAALEVAAKELDSARNALRDHATPSDLIGAARDARGAPIEIDGVVYDHLGEVRSTVDSVRAAEDALVRTTTSRKNPNLEASVPSALEKLGQGDLVDGLATTLDRFADQAEQLYQ